MYWRNLSCRFRYSVGASMRQPEKRWSIFSVCLSYGLHFGSLPFSDMFLWKFLVGRLKQISTQALPTITTQVQQSTNKNQLHSTHTFILLLPGRYPAPASPQNLPPLLSRHTLTWATHKDGPKDSTMVEWWLNQPHSKDSFRKPFLKTRTTKTLEVPSVKPPKNYKWASIIKTSLIPPTITHSNWSTCLRSQFWVIHFPHTTQPSPNSAHLTSRQWGSFW